jgi:hypothetical protein
MNRRKTTIVATIALLLAVSAAWALGMFHRTDPQVAELQQMRDEMFAERDVPREERRQQFNEFRQRMDNLSEEQRQQLWQSGREEWTRRIEERMDEFFALAPEEQQQRLDEIIDRMVERRQQREQNPGGDGRRGGGRGDWQNMSDAQRDARRKQRLDQTSPKMRAQFTEFRRMMEDRMEERGLSSSDFGGPRGFRGWGRGA